MNVDQGHDPRTGAPVGEPVPHTTAAELDQICLRAQHAAPALAATTPRQRAGMLRAVADALGEDAAGIVALADAETALGTARLAGEMRRTQAQLRMFAEALIEGSVLEAVIDLPDPEAVPAPRPDLRRMLVPVGPVAVYAASNFPLAFSVPGGDTASALAAGCPVVVKTHPSHPALSQRCARVMIEALTSAGAPAGSLAVVSGMDAGRALVSHPAIRAAGFTGSLAGGRALFDLAAARPDPIPFYGEFGSLNPVVVTPGGLRAGAEELVSGFVNSFTLGSGQFCTKPGLLFLPAGHGLEDALAARLSQLRVHPLLDDRIRSGFQQTLAELAGVPAVRTVASGPPAAPGGYAVAPVVLATSAPDLVAHAATLLRECFGPAALLVEYQTSDDLLAALAVLPGCLAGAVHADVAQEPELVHRVSAELAARAGRVIVGGWPTGVAVTWAMQHGGPWPATSHAGHTSVGVTAMRRFQRPVVYQDAPPPVLPPALHDRNPWAIPRRVNGRVTTDPL